MAASIAVPDESAAGEQASPGDEPFAVGVVLGGALRRGGGVDDGQLDGHQVSMSPASARALGALAGARPLSAGGPVAGVCRQDLGRSPRTVDAYARSLVDYLRFCERHDVDVVACGAGGDRRVCSRSARAAGPARRERGRDRLGRRARERDAAAADHGRAAVLRLPGRGAASATATRSRRGYRAGGRVGSAGGAWSPRFESLPWIPTDAQWRAMLEVAAGESLRNRLMLALAYDAALRREELCLLGTDDLDPAHRTITVRAETTKTRRGRVVPYSAVAGQLLAGYLRASPLDHDGARRVVRVGVAAQPGGGRSRRGRGRRWCGRSRSGPACRAFSTHTLRHLCLTDLARSGWELHQIATFAGHRATETTQRYIHLSGRDLAERLGERDDADPRRRGSRRSARCSS